MRVVVTGGAGFIGTNLVKFLLQKKINILNFDALKYSSNIKSLNLEKKNKYYQFIKGNICDEKKFLQILKKFKPNGVINLAAESHVDRSIDNPAPFLKTNIFGTYSLLKALNTYLSNLNKKEKKFFKFIHVSTDEVYGDLPLNRKPANELSPFNPSSPYAASKASSDHLVKAWARTYNLPVIITNCSNNYGAYQHPEKFIPHIIISILKNKRIPIYGNGRQIRDWIHVRDHSDAIFKVFKKGKIGETYNIGASNQKRNLEIAKIIFSVLKKFNKKKNNKNFFNNVNFVKDRPGHDKRYAIDGKKIKKLGWIPKVNFEQGIEETVKWYLENKNWWSKILKNKYKLERIGKIK